jgi:hypothetical protein
MLQLRGEDAPTISELPDIEPGELESRFAPERLSVSPMFTAILARLLGGFRWTEPVIAEIILTSDGSVLVRHDGEFGANNHISHVDDLKMNLRGVVNAVNPNRDERIRLAILFARNVTNHGCDFDPTKFLGVD